MIQKSKEVDAKYFHSRNMLKIFYHTNFHLYFAKMLVVHQTLKNSVTKLRSICHRFNEIFDFNLQSVTLLIFNHKFCKSMESPTFFYSKASNFNRCLIFHTDHEIFFSFFSWSVVQYGTIYW